MITKNVCPGMRKNKIALTIVGSIAAYACSGGYAIAQEAAKSSSRGIDEIIVTANKRSQSITDVGLSITATTGEALMERGVMSATDLGKIVPGLTVQPSPFNTPVYTLRGVGFYETTLSAAPTVAVYVDQVQLPFSATTKGATFDIERVEVLKGPQGTLFGQNTTGGAINYIAAKPTDEFAMGVDAGYGRFNNVDIQGYISGPLTETLKGRLALNVIQSDDWQKSYTRDDELGEKDQIQGRMILDWSPSDDLNMIFTASAWQDKGENQAAQLIDDTCGADLSGTCGSPKAQNFRVYPRAPNDLRAADWGYGVFGRNNERDDSFYQASLRIDYDINDRLTLTSISAYSDYDTDSVQDFDGSTYATVDTNTTGYIKDFSQEIRIAGDYDRFNFIVGGNYSDTKTFDRLFYAFFEGPSSDPLWSIPGAPFGDYTFNYSDQDIKTAAIFANIEYDITDSLTLVAGARYTDSKRDFEGCTNDYEGPSQTDVWWNTIFGTNVQNGGCITFTQNFPEIFDPALFDQLDEDNTSWNLGLNYALANDGLLYGRISKGYKSGSFPTASVSSYSGYIPVKQESVLAYELGVKSPFLDNTVNLSAAIFYYDYTDKQLRGRSPDAVFGTLDALVQIPESEVKGAEMELVAQPFDGFRMSIGATYIETEVTKFEGYNALGTLNNFSGQEFPFAPELTVIGDASYEFSLTDSLNAFVGVSFTHNSETSSQLDNTTTAFVTADERFDVDAYTLVDLRAGVVTADGKLKVMAYSYNVTDEFYWTNVQNNLASISRFTGQPRTYGIRISWHY
ncbi:MAG: TonB-dependent receptor [Porticoccaceae bacterium]